VSNLSHAVPPVPGHITAIERPVSQLMNYYVLKALSTTVAFPIVLLLLYFRYHTMRYRFDAEGIHMRWGILFRHEIVLNYSRIQDIHLQSNFVERWLGLARIQIQTAAGSANAEMTLEGLTDHEGMRDFLYSRMRGARDSYHEGGAAGPSLASTLSEIAAELRAIRRHFEEQQGA
jgi:putative membrane protein